MSNPGCCFRTSLIVTGSFWSESSQINNGFATNLFEFDAARFPGLCDTLVRFSALGDCLLGFKGFCIDAVGVGNVNISLVGNGGIVISPLSLGESVDGYGHDEGDWTFSLLP